MGHTVLFPRTVESTARAVTVREVTVSLLRSSQPVPPPSTLRARLAPAHADVDDAIDDAVREAHVVLDRLWPRWAAEHGLTPPPAITCAPARVSIVGSEPSQFRPVAVVHFTFCLDGHDFAGLARGPLEAPLLRVTTRPAAEPVVKRRWTLRGRKRLH